MTALFAVTMYADVYAPEQMQEMAAAQAALTKGDAREIKTMTSAYAFKGYIAALLDNNKRFAGCAAHHDLDAIAYRSAMLVAGKSSVRSSMASIDVFAAVVFACESFGE